MNLKISNVDVDLLQSQSQDLKKVIAILSAKQHPMMTPKMWGAMLGVSAMLDTWVESTAGEDSGSPAASENQIPPGVWAPLLRLEQMLTDLLMAHRMMGDGVSSHIRYDPQRFYEIFLDSFDGDDCDHHVSTSLVHCRNAVIAVLKALPQEVVNAEIA